MKVLRSYNAVGIQYFVDCAANVGETYTFLKACIERCPERCHSFVENPATKWSYVSHVRAFVSYESLIRSLIGFRMIDHVIASGYMADSSVTVCHWKLGLNQGDASGGHYSSKVSFCKPFDWGL